MMISGHLSDQSTGIAVGQIGAMVLAKGCPKGEGL